MMHLVLKVVTDTSIVEKTWEEFAIDEQNRTRAKNGDMFQDVITELNSGRFIVRNWRNLSRQGEFDRNSRWS